MRVTDNGSPLLYDEETITVTVTAAALTTTSVTTESVSKVVEKTAIAEATLYPNPVVNNVTIILNHISKNMMLKIVDMKGTTVYSQQYNGYMQQVQMNVAALYAGTYMVLLQTTDANQMLKFIKQ